MGTLWFSLNKNYLQALWGVSEFSEDQKGGLGVIPVSPLKNKTKYPTGQAFNKLHLHVCPTPYEYLDLLIHSRAERG